MRADDIPPYRDRVRHERLGARRARTSADGHAIDGHATTEESIMSSFSIGDGVRTKSGPMQHQYGTVVHFREDDGTILVRFGGSQQLYFREDELEPWA